MLRPLADSSLPSRKTGDINSPEKGYKVIRIEPQSTPEQKHTQESEKNRTDEIDNHTSRKAHATHVCVQALELRHSTDLDHGCS